MGIPLEPDDGQMRALLEAAGSFVRTHINTLPEQPSWDLDDFEQLVAEMREPPPASGRPFDEVLARFAAAAAKSLNTAGPGYLAYIPGGGLFTTAIADLLADALNRYVGMWFAAPALTQIEATVLRWMLDLFGYPAAARGILTTGGSMANFSAIVAARHALLGEDLAPGTIYVTEHTHHSVQKAAILAGIRAANVRAVPADASLRMDADALARMVAADVAAGLKPFFVVASLGTTNTGAIDPIRAIEPVARAHGLWLHADAAYGGFFQLTERGRRAFAGVERVDSITLDPHKGMFLPYGTGALLVRDGAALRAAHTVGEATAYLQDLAPEDELPNFTDYGPELSRDFRGLRVWLPLQVHGVDAFREALDEKLDLTRALFDGLSSIPEVEVPWEPELTVVAFRYRPDTRDADALNRRLLDAINASRRIFCSSTVVDGRLTLRACIVSHRTHRDRIDEALEIIRRTVKEIGG